MPDLSQSATNYLDDLARQPAARQPATIGEIWDSEWKRGGLDTITGIGKPLADARGELSTAIEAAAGKPIADYAAEQRIPLGAGATVDQNIKALNDLADTLPEDAKKTIDPLRDVRRRSMQKAQQIERDAADVSSATYGLGGTATAWAAGIARQSSDPVNLAMMAATAPIGGPITGGAVKFIAGQAAAGAIAQAAVEPYIEPTRAELGLDSGIGRAAGNILEAGVGGAVLGGAGVGLHRLFRAAATAYRGARPVEAGIQQAAEPPLGESPVPTVDHPNLTAEDFSAAALHAERNAVTEAPPGVDPIAHGAAVSQATQALEDGTPLPRPQTELPAPPERAAPAEPGPPQSELPLPKPIEPVAPDSVGSFTTAKGSTYAIHEDGTTTRDKAARADVGHEGDSGPKARSARTIYIDGDASVLSGAGLQGDFGGKGYRVAIKDGKANFLWWNEKADKWGAPESGRDIPFTTTPEVGKSPVELWKPSTDVPGYEAYRGQHAGNVITEVRFAEKPAEVIGDPALAKDLDTRLATMPEADTHVFHVEQPDKSIKSGTAKSFLKEIADDARAVKELIDCVGKEPA